MLLIGSRVAAAQIHKSTKTDRLQPSHSRPSALPSCAAARPSPSTACGLARTAAALQHTATRATSSALGQVARAARCHPSLQLCSTHRPLHPAPVPSALHHQPVWCTAGLQMPTRHESCLPRPRSQNLASATLNQMNCEWFSLTGGCLVAAAKQQQRLEMGQHPQRGLPPAGLHCLPCRGGWHRCTSQPSLLHHMACASPLLSMCSAP